MKTVRLKGLAAAFLAAAALALLCAAVPVRADGNPVWAEARTVETDRGAFRVTAVFADLNDPRADVFPVEAREVGGSKVAPLAAMAEAFGAAAAINGTYFNLGTKEYGQLLARDHLILPSGPDLCDMRGRFETGLWFGPAPGRSLKLGWDRCSRNETDWERRMYPGSVSWDRVRHFFGHDRYVFVSDGRPVYSDAEALSLNEKSHLKSPRSFLGVTADNVLILGTVGGADLADVMHTALAMGCVLAVGLDGGGSCQLWHDARYLAGPGREIPNCIVVTVRDEPKVYVEVEGKPAIHGAPYLDGDVTMCPVRDLARGLGWAVSWDGSRARLAKGGKEVVVEPSSAAALVDGKPAEMPRPAALRGGRLYVPLRFAAEALGAEVEWRDGWGVRVWDRAAKSSGGIVSLNDGFPAEVSPLLTTGSWCCLELE
ncbi:MAG: stalk domain-containing protein, partial [Desulfotomaculales bacterium]